MGGPDVLARELPPAERDEAFPKIVAAAPGFADYQPQDQPRHPAARDTEGMVAPNVISPAISYFAVETSFETRDEPHYTYRVEWSGRSNTLVSSSARSSQTCSTTANVRPNRSSSAISAATVGIGPRNARVDVGTVRIAAESGELPTPNTA